jgi:hypothetical protein
LEESRKRAPNPRIEFGSLCFVCFCSGDDVLECGSEILEKLKIRICRIYGMPVMNSPKPLPHGLPIKDDM